MAMTFQAYHRARRMGLALTRVRSAVAWMKRETEADLVGERLREAFTKIFGESPSNRRRCAPLFAERIDTRSAPDWLLPTTRACVCCEFIDRRATERELSILRKRLQTSVVPGNIAILKRSVRN